MYAFQWHVTILVLAAFAVVPSLSASLAVRGTSDDSSLVARDAPPLINEIKAFLNRRSPDALDGRQVSGPGTGNTSSPGTGDTNSAPSGPGTSGGPSTTDPGSGHHHRRRV